MAGLVVAVPTLVGVRSTDGVNDGVGVAASPPPDPDWAVALGAAVGLRVAELDGVELATTPLSVSPLDPGSS